MKSSWRLVVVNPLLALSLVAASPPARAQHSGHGGPVAAPEFDRPYTEKLKIGEDGAVTFPGPTAVGEWLLKPGRYRFEHAVEGEAHFISFSRSDTPTSAPPEVRVRCQLERMKKPAKKTEVYALVYGAGARKLDRIHVQGESAKHVF